MDYVDFTLKAICTVAMFGALCWVVRMRLHKLLTKGDTEHDADIPGDSEGMEQ